MLQANLLHENVQKQGSINGVNMELLHHKYLLLFKNCKFHRNSVLSTATAFSITISVVGWLADVYFGQYKVICCSMWIMWSAFLLAAISSEVAQFVKSYGHMNDYINGVLMIIAMVGLGAFEANIIQFGLDQLHDASTDEITSFIIWFIWTGYVGGYVVHVAIGCTMYPNKYWLAGMLVVCAYLGSTLGSLFTCNHLLVKEPVIQNPFKLLLGMPLVISNQDAGVLLLTMKMTFEFLLVLIMVRVNMEDHSQQSRLKMSKHSSDWWL